MDVCIYDTVKSFMAKSRISYLLNIVVFFSGKVLEIVITQLFFLRPIKTYLDSILLLSQ